MADIELVIKIPKKAFNEIREHNITHCGEPFAQKLVSYIRNGTPLPKKMLSVDLIIETLCPKDEDYDYPCIAPSYLEEELERLLLNDVSTIIGADAPKKREGIPLEENDSGYNCENWIP